MDFPVPAADGKFVSFLIYLREKTSKRSKQNHPITGCCYLLLLKHQCRGSCKNATRLAHVGAPVSEGRARGEVPCLCLFPLSRLPRGIHHEGTRCFGLPHWISKEEECNSFNLTEKEQNETPTHWGNCSPLRRWWGPKSCYLQRALFGVTQLSHCVDSTQNLKLNNGK